MKHGIRVPSPISTTMSIVGALVLGEAAVSASIVSPISIIIVAITGLTSFAIPNFSLEFHFRILRFAFIFLGMAFTIIEVQTSPLLFLFISSFSIIYTEAVCFLIYSSLLLK